MNNLSKLVLSLFLLSNIISCSKTELDLSISESTAHEEIRNIGPVLTIIVERAIDQDELKKTLNRPYGIAVDLNQNIYLSDFGNNRILKFDSTFKFIREAGGGGRQEGLLSDPTYITIDNDLNLYVAEEGNRRVSRFDRRLNFVDYIDLYSVDETLGIGTPSAVAIGDYGETWVTDNEQNRINVYDYLGNYQKFVGDFGYSGSQLLSPSKIITDENKNYYVCDSGNRRIVVYDEYGNYAKSFRSKLFNYPVSLALHNNLLWVLDYESGALVLLDDNGTVTNYFKSEINSLDKPLSSPTDFAFLGDDKLLIVDSGNNRLLLCKILYDKNISE